MKILMLTTNSSLMDGINRHILTIAPVLNKCDGCEVAVCTVFPRAELAESLEKEGVRVFSLNANNGHDIKVFFSFNKIMQEYKPDIIHSHVMALYERILLSVFYRTKKYIQTVHGISDEVTYETLIMKFNNALYKFFKIKYDAICYISNGVRDYLSNPNDIERAYTIYNPIDFNQDIRKEYKLHKLIGVPEDVPIIGTCCRIAKVKNPDLFTKVMCHVLQKNNQVHAVVIGDGDEYLMQEMKQIVQEANLRKRFHFLGYRPDAPDLVQDFDCFVMTSTSEGLPTSVLEAMSSKIPFAMLEGNGGLKDIASINCEQGPIGVVVPTGDVISLAKGICDLVENPDYAQTLANNAYEVGRRYFDVGRACAQLLDIYNVILK